MFRVRILQEAGDAIGAVDGMPVSPAAIVSPPSGLEFRLYTPRASFPLVTAPVATVMPHLRRFLRCGVRARSFAVGLFDLPTERVRIRSRRPRAALALLRVPDFGWVADPGLRSRWSLRHGAILCEAPSGLAIRTFYTQ